MQHTPASKDKHLWANLAVIFSVMASKVFMGTEFSGELLGFFSFLSIGYMLQSQAGRYLTGKLAQLAPAEEPK